MTSVKRTSGPGEKQLQLALRNLDKKVGKVGWFSSAVYEGGPPVAYVATIQEYGYAGKNIPPRPFMRPTVVKYRKKWGVLAGKYAEAIAKGQKTVSDMMEGLGQTARGNIQQTISEVFEPELKKKTVQARKNRKTDKKTVGNLTKPLIDTGLMLATVTNTVENE